MSIMNSILGFFNTTPSETNTVELVDFKVKQIDECAGFHFEWRYTLTIRVNGVKKKSVYQTDKNFTQVHFRQMFTEAMGTSDTLFQAMSKYNFVVSDKFKASKGNKYL